MLPPAIITALVRFGPFLDDTGKPFTGDVVFTASRPRVWEATGTPVLPRGLRVPLDETGSGEIRLPATDQPGFTDGVGNAVTNWTIKAEVRLSERENETRSFALPTGGQTDAVIDLDLLTPVPSSTGVVVELPAVYSVAGESGAVSAQTIADRVGPLLPPSGLDDQGVADVIADPTSATGAAFAAAVTAVTPVRAATKLWMSTSHRARMNQLGGLTNGTDTGAMTRVRNVAPYLMTEVRVGYSNVYSQGARETPGPNPITVRAAIEWDGKFFPLFKNGSRDLVLAPGTFVEFDTIFPNIPKGAVYYVRTLVTVETGGRWPWGTFQGVASPNADGVEQGTSVTDKTTSGTVTTSNNYAYGPTSVRARRVDGGVDIVAIGDSISFGTGDSQDRGMIVRAINDQYPLRNLGYAGSQASEFLDGRYAQLRLQIAGGATHWIMLYGTNDIAGAKTAAQLKAALTACYEMGATLGAQVWAGTIPPRTTSTDAWATTGSQSVAATEAVRVEVNNWIRTTPAPLDGYFEIADALETGRNTGIWKANHTSDGIHPNQTGSVAGALAIDPALFS